MASHSNRKTLSPKEVEGIYGISHKTLCKWRREARGPRFSQFGRVVLYRVEDVEKWLEANAVKTLAA